MDHEAWLAQVTEDIVDPDREIVDPHHHLFGGGRLGEYLVPELVADTGSGHRVTRTVHVECGHAYRPDGPAHLRPVGETEFVARAAAESEELGGARIAGLVAHADLRLPLPQLDEVLDAHEAAGGGLFKGIRHSGSSALHPETLSIPGRAPAGLYLDADFQRGVRHLGARGLTYDTWHYHHQNREFLELARAVPETTIVLDHFGTPLGVGPFRGASRRDLRDVAGRHRRHRHVPERGGEARRTGHARQRLRVGHGASAADQRRARGRAGALVPPHDRVLRRRSLHVRVELPGRPPVPVVSGPVERPEEDGRSATTRPSRTRSSRERRSASIGSRRSR